MDAKASYEQTVPKLDPDDFKPYSMIERMTGFGPYGQFLYEDARGMPEMINDHQLVRYLPADQFHAVQWKIALETCYERAALLPLGRVALAYQALEQKLCTAVLHDYHLNSRKQHDRKGHNAR